jgi:hypothetical protein
VVPLFIGVTLVNLICLGTAVTIGYLSAYQPALKSWHLLTGVLATFTCVAVHCIVFTYFMATSKWVQHAVTVKRLDASFAAPTRSFRAQAFPAALVAILSVFIAAILGAAHDNYATPRSWHRSMALASLVINAAVALIEYRAIARNGKLIDDVLATIRRDQPAPSPAPV